MEEAFRQETVAALAFVPLAPLVGDSLTHTLLLLITCAQVICAELINTAIESIVGRERDPLSGLANLAKDLGSALVFVTLMLFLVIWIPSLWTYGRGLLTIGYALLGGRRRDRVTKRSTKFRLSATGQADPPCRQPRRRDHVESNTYQCDGETACPR